jgi:hypothetical protein
MSASNIIVQPAIVGVVGAVGSLALVDSSLVMYGMPAPVALGLAIGGSSMVSATMKETVYDNVLKDSESDLLFTATTPVITGLSAVVLYRLAAGKLSKKSAMQTFALGALSEITGAYIDDNMLGDAVNF